MLSEKNFIRSQLAFDIYTRLKGVRSRLQAGTYSLSRSESTRDIVGHLMAGQRDQITITFYPGATLRDLSGPDENKEDAKSVLLKAGYKEEEIEAAFAKQYSHPLFADKPEGTDLEGYVYGETYKFDSGSTAEQVLTGTFDHFYKDITDNNLLEGFKRQNLNLYQAVTLASIIQREVSGANDQRQVSQIFLLRLKRGMMLGADATYKYAAKKLGVPPALDLNSPYNTRKFAGLPPGPIAVPGLSALQAVANPAPGEYVYFVSGDDDVNYFAKTFEEHEANIRKHCHKKCAEI